MYFVAERRTIVNVESVRKKSVNLNLFRIITMVVDGCVCINKDSIAEMIELLCSRR